MNAKIEELKKTLREARDHTYLGRYQESQKLFKKIVDTIEQEVMMHNVDRRMLEEWRKFESGVLA